MLLLLLKFPPIKLNIDQPSLEAQPDLILSCGGAHQVLQLVHIQTPKFRLLMVKPLHNCSCYKLVMQVSDVFMIGSIT